VYLAETISLSGGEMALILGVFVAVVVSWILAAILGFRWASRAARGSSADAVKWAVAAAVVLLPGVLVGPNPLLIPGLVVVGAQAAVYFRAKGSPRP
jgi:hypothetical protein